MAEVLINPNSTLPRIAMVATHGYVAAQPPLGAAATGGQVGYVLELGKNQDWEFNEWIHSRTGRPMGKAFQAWLAASYIHACHEMQISPESLASE